MKRIAIFALVALAAAAGSVRPSQAAEVLPSVEQRFATEAKPGTSAGSAAPEVPNFQRHVVPLLGRLGCNGRACHGSFQGQGGFRLSLFGYDFAADHEALVGGKSPRVDKAAPAKSLLIEKPTLAVEHEGGRRLEADWQRRLLERWIAGGAKPVDENAPTFTTLEVEPREILFRKPGDTAALCVVALWSDGTREDVTPLARFRSNDDSTAVVDAAGRITAVASGDTEIVAFYDNGVVPVSVLLPTNEHFGPAYPPTTTLSPLPTTGKAANAPIDNLVHEKLKKLGIVPSDLCTDAEFLRRVSLDLTGTLPAPDEVARFLAKTSAAKRAEKIDELLARPTYVAWQTNRLCDMTGNNAATGPLGGERGLNEAKSRHWYRWIQRRVADNMPYDELVAGIVLAVSREPDQDFEAYCREMAGYFRAENQADFADNATMPHYWTRKTLGKPEDKALAFAHSFLGVSLQCAQCHKHPFDQWTKQDFDQFTAFFAGIRWGDTGSDRAAAQAMKKELGLTMDEDSGKYRDLVIKLAAAGTLQPFKELTVPPAKKLTEQERKRREAANKAAAKDAKLKRVITPRLLGGEEVIASEYPDPRLPVMEWIRQPDNPYFARAFVNRVWAGYFHRGLIEPTDDLNLANPPSHPELLDYLTDKFIASGYDMKALHREIVTSRTYQLSHRPNDTNRRDERNLSRAVIRRLPAEVAYDAVALATSSSAERKSLDADPAASRAIGITGGAIAKLPSAYALNLFGKPQRAINCDCERSLEPSLLQTVYLRNDGDLWNRLKPTTGWLAEVKAAKRTDVAALVDEAYRRTLSRPPYENERKLALDHFAASEDVVSALRSLMWSLLNTKEFLLNH